MNNLINEIQEYLNNVVKPCDVGECFCIGCPYSGTCNYLEYLLEEEEEEEE